MKHDDIVRKNKLVMSNSKMKRLEKGYIVNVFNLDNIVNSMERLSDHFRHVII